MMEKHMNPYDKEYMKMAMLKHEETFREQVYELHRLYRIQKILMKDIVKNPRNDHHQPVTTARNQPEARLCLDLDRPAGEFSVSELGRKCSVLEVETDHDTNLELTLGPAGFCQKKNKADAPARDSDSGPSFSSSSTGSSQVKGTRILTREGTSGHQKWGGLEMPVSNQDRLNNAPWIFRALSLNIT